MSENVLKQLKALRAQVRKYKDTLDLYEKLFKEDGVIDATERRKLDQLGAAIAKIEGKIEEREEELNFGGRVTNQVSETTESVGDFFSRTDDQVDHSLMDLDTTVDTPSTDAPTVDTPSTDTPTVDTPSTDAPTVDTPSTDAPTVDTPSTDAPTVDTPSTDTPTENTPPTDTSADKYAAIAETPAVKEFLNGIHKSEGGYVDDPGDPGGKTKYGIAEKREWPVFAEMFGLDVNNPALIKDITKKQVDEYYIKTRFEQNGLDKINSPKVINAIFDQSILTPGIVKKNMKRALVALDSNNKFPINNSEFSAAEITAINASNADKLVEKFVVYQNEYYDGLVKKNPGKFKRYINGWKNRTARLTGFSGGGDDDSSSASSTADTGASSSGDTFEVPSGWGLNKIAAEKGITVEQLKAWNADKLKTYGNGSQGFNVGEMIVVKKGSSNTISEGLFEVPKGWGLTKIARKKGVTEEQLKAWNADKLKTYRNGSQGFNAGEMIVVEGGSVSSDTTVDETGDEGEVTAAGYIKPSWLKEAEKHLGKKETATMVKDDPWITLLFNELGAAASGWAETQTVLAANWCAAFVSYCLKKTGQAPLTGFPGMRARTYGEKYGKEINRPVYGALVIVARGGAGHIGIVVGYDKNTKALTILGGNQGNKVSIKKEDRKILAYRVPSSWKIPEQNYLD